MVADVPADPVAPSWNRAQLSPQSLDRLAELVTRPESELLPEWERLRDGLMITKFEEFASRVQSLGVEYDCPPLQTWA